jgi:hypothetical protein
MAKTNTNYASLDAAGNAAGAAHESLHDGDAAEGSAFADGRFV